MAGDGGRGALAFAVVLRFHYAVAAGVFVILALTNDWKRWGWLIVGAIPVVPPINSLNRGIERRLAWLHLSSTTAET